MARIARVVATNIPHHVTHRGNRRQKTFFQDEDYRQYLNLMAEWCKRHNVEVWAYCLMPNHVHLIAASRNQKMVYGVQSVRRIDDIQGMLIFVRDGAGIYGKGGFTRFRWMKVIFLQRHDMSNSIL